MRLKLYAKCDDRCSYVLSEDGNEIIDTDGYPPYIPSITCTDAVKIEIDLETGMIIGFNKEMVASYVKDLIADAQDDEEED